MRRALAILVLLVACAGDSPYGTAPARPLPDPSTEVRTLDVGDGTWTLYDRAEGCLQTAFVAGGRHRVGGPWPCPTGAIDVAMHHERAEVVFNDRQRRFRRCDDTEDCPGPTPDVVLPSEVLVGHVPAMVGAVCVATDAAPLVLAPDGDGYVLDAVPIGSSQREVLLFLADGRLVGPDRPQDALLDACRAQIAPGWEPPPTTEWTVRLELPEALRGEQVGVFLATDTGFSAEGMTAALIEDGETFRVVLHEDTTALLIGFEEPFGHLDQRVELPDRTPCRASQLAIVFDGNDAAISDRCG